MLASASRDEAWITSTPGPADPYKVISTLLNQAAYHAITKHDPFNTISTSLDEDIHSIFTFNSRYSSETFQGIMPDTGASGISTAGYPQYLALQKLNPKVQLDETTRGREIKFGKGIASTKGTIQVPTPLGIITFHVVAADTPFLLCIQDMDRVGAYFQNLENIIV